MKTRFLFALGATALACGPQRSHAVDDKPIASFRLTQSTVRPQVFSFDASASSVVVGSLAKYRWTFGDEAGGAPATEATAAVQQHAYAAAGTFTVTLVVVDDQDAASDPVSQQVTVASVNAAGPTAVVSGPSTGQPGTPLTFDGSGSTPSADLQSYAWDFGDGVTSAGKDKTLVQHTYSASGQFTVTLTVTDSLGTSDSAELHVSVGEVGPLAVCTFSPQLPTQGASVMFDASQSVVPMGASAVYVWDFGDGVMNVPGKTVSHTYSGAGPYTPKLTVNVQGRPSNTASCPTVMPAAPGLCTGDYSWMGMSSQQLLCGTFSGSGVTITETSNGAITVSEPYGTGTLDYTGTWSGNTFTASGTHVLSDGLHHAVTVTGTFSGCDVWTGTYHDDTEGLIQCDYTVSSTHL